jgi:hypothetical protein
MDQFYTKDSVAQKCLGNLQAAVDLKSYNAILEPSAGRGSFYKLLPKGRREGIDLEPKYRGVKKGDYLKYKPKDNKKYLVVGNPPFGRVSSMAIKFFNKSATFADVIAFIVPRTFKRVSVQNKLSLNFSLVSSEDLPLTPCCFEPKMPAKCCFQIWKRVKIPREKIEYDKCHPDFTFLRHGPKDERNQPTPPEDYDFALKAYGSNCGRIVDGDLSHLRPKSWHWIKSNIDPQKLKKRFNSLDFSISKDTVRQDSLGQKELIYLYKSRNDPS